jgi:chemotaxis-related protein WspB
MLALLLKIGQELYAIPARSVIEVVPKVMLHQMPAAPGWLAGLFPYRGKPMPVVDLCMLVLDTPCASLLSSRIVVVERMGTSGTERYGILSERMTDVVRLNGQEFPPANVRAAPYVKGTLLEDDKIIQLLALDAVMPCGPNTFLSAGP